MRFCSEWRSAFLLSIQPFIYLDENESFCLKSIRMAITVLSLGQSTRFIIPGT